MENITIEAVAAEGKCITRVDDQVIFVPFCVPGDVVDLQVVKKKHKYCEAKVVRFIKKSDIRQEPMCEHFGICGGCKWQNLPYEEQIKAKQKQVEDQLTRIGKIELPEFRPIMGSVKTQEYRNKIEFGCSNKRWFTAEELSQLPQKEDDTVSSLKERHAQNAIGFHITGAFDKIYPIRKCWLMDDLCNEIRNFVFEYADSHDYTFYDLREQHGLLRNMMIRNSNTGEWMLVFQFHYDEEGDEQKALELMQQVADKFPQISSLMYVDNQKGNDTINDLELSLFKGNDHIFELMEDLKFKVGPKSFYQTNTEQAYHLYCVAREFANLTGDELVYDLYTGEYRRSTKKDCGQAALMADYLPSIDIHERAVSAQDVPAAVAPLHEVAVNTTNCSKHIVQGCGTVENLRRIYKVMCHIAGGEEAYRANPIYSTITCPISPLQLVPESTAMIMESARLGIPIVIISMALAGGTTPVTLAGTLLTHNAEALASIVLSQATVKGAPVVYGSSTSIMDLKYTCSPVGCPELGMINASVAKLAQFYGIPSWVAGG